MNQLHSEMINVSFCTCLQTKAHTTISLQAMLGALSGVEATHITVKAAGQGERGVTAVLVPTIGKPSGLSSSNSASQASDSNPADQHVASMNWRRKCWSVPRPQSVSLTYEWTKTALVLQRVLFFRN
jgi:hypothetical protein